jgi:proteic killer suppression protein
VIESFRSKALEVFFESGKGRGLNPNFLKKIALILDALENAETLDDLTAAGFGVHPLKSEREGEYSMVVSRNWRITLRFEDGNAYDVDCEGYH